MRILQQIVTLWRALFKSARIDADLADEMRFHVERETDAYIELGMSPDAARRAAHLARASRGPLLEFLATLPEPYPHQPPPYERYWPFGLDR